MILEENPTIRQTVFILSPTLSYTFDVNQTIQIHYLKKMIAAAAHLRKGSFNIYHEGKDYTDQDESKLVELFPNIQKVVFTLQQCEVEELEDSVMKVRITSYCPFHEYKHLSFYCFTCKKSICSLCVLSKEHAGHDYREKADYLQASKHLVDLAFKNNPTFNSDPKLEYKVSNEMILFRENMRMVMFKTLQELLGKVEAKLNEMIDFYNKINNESCMNLQDNIHLIRNYCAKGLDQLKEDICIQKILIDESVFLTFDSKYRTLYTTQNEKFDKDIKKFKALNSEIVLPLKEFVNKTYHDIYTVLISKIEANEYEYYKKLISEKQIKLIDEKEIINQISPSNGSEGKSQEKKRPYSTFINDITNAINNHKSNSGQKRNSTSNIPLPAYTIDSLSDKGANSTTQQISNTDNNSITAGSITQEFNQKIQKTPAGLQHIMIPIKGTKKVKIVYNVNKEETKDIQFELFLGTNSFFSSSAHCNHKNFLFVTGGLEMRGIESSSSNSFFKYDLFINKVFRLPNMNTARHNHSMLESPNHLYAVGGARTNTAERYDFTMASWVKLPPMKFQRQFPILWIYEDYLYAFFGLDENGQYLETIERLSLSNFSKKGWELVKYSNPQRLNLKLYGAGISEISGSLYFFGGMKEGKAVNTIFFYDFDSSEFQTDEQDLDWNEYFNETKLFLLGDYHGQICEEKYSGIFLQLSQ